ncbi:MAG: putative colanic acid biosynthesis acetyltransferase [Rhodospirillales bacterium]|nr:putative colanic acid biosynthesis acetyltransferase [Rhodospirillales bacterium]
MKILDAADSQPFDGGPSFSLGHRAYRALWNIAWCLLASWTPPFFNPWRRQVLRAFGARITSTARIHGSARIWYPANLVMAEHACLGPRVNCYSMAKITLDAYALASQGAHLCAGTHDIDDQNFQLCVAPITIGKKAWIAAEAFVGPGVNVGEGAVLGARGVAFGDLEPWTVYAGNPAREIKKRKR